MNETPTASILAPEDDSGLTDRDEISFVGEGHDPEDGALDNGESEWFSSIDGLIGTGQTVTTLVGESGKITAIEYDSTLAQRAKENLSSYPMISVVHRDGAEIDFDEADVIYVNAGVTRPADRWLDRLSASGRLILPLTTDDRRGGVLLIQRLREDFLAKFISSVIIIPAEGMRDDVTEALLADAFAGGRAEEVTRLYRRADVPEGRCWLRAPDWCLAYT